MKIFIDIKSAIVLASWDQPARHLIQVIDFLQLSRSVAFSIDKMDLVSRISSDKRRKYFPKHGEAEGSVGQVDTMDLASVVASKSRQESLADFQGWRMLGHGKARKVDNCVNSVVLGFATSNCSFNRVDGRFDIMSGGIAWDKVKSGASIFVVALNHELLACQMLLKTVFPFRSDF